MGWFEILRLCVLVFFCLYGCYFFAFAMVGFYVGVILWFRVHCVASRCVGLCCIVICVFVFLFGRVVAGSVFGFWFSICCVVWW